MEVDCTASHYGNSHSLYVSTHLYQQICHNAGIFVSDILDAVPIDKYFELFKPSAGGEGGFIRLGLDFVKDPNDLPRTRGEQQHVYHHAFQWERETHLILYTVTQQSESDLLCLSYTRSQACSPALWLDQVICGQLCLDQWAPMLAFGTVGEQAGLSYVILLP